jgi:hypothetical protein
VTQVKPPTVEIEALVEAYGPRKRRWPMSVDWAYKTVLWLQGLSPSARFVGRILDRGGGKPLSGKDKARFERCKASGALDREMERRAEFKSVGYGKKALSGKIPKEDAELLARMMLEGMARTDLPKVAPRRRARGDSENNRAKGCESMITYIEPKADLDALMEKYGPKKRCWPRSVGWVNKTVLWLQGLSPSALFIQRVANRKPGSPPLTGWRKARMDRYLANGAFERELGRHGEYEATGYAEKVAKRGMSQEDLELLCEMKLMGRLGRKDLPRAEARIRGDDG